MTTTPGAAPPFDLKKAFEQLQKTLLNHLGASDIASVPCHRFLHRSDFRA